MTTQTSREQFEAKVRATYSYMSLTRDGENYNSVPASVAWWGWQASRAALEAQAEPVDLIEWIEEAVEYVGCTTWSPSLEDEGRRLLARLKVAPKPPQ